MRHTIIRIMTSSGRQSWWAEIGDGVGVGAITGATIGVIIVVDSTVDSMAALAVASTAAVALVEDMAAAAIDKQPENEEPWRNQPAAFICAGICQYKWQPGGRRG